VKHYQTALLALAGAVVVLAAATLGGY